MATVRDFQRMALSLPEATEGTHGGHPDFRVGNKAFASSAFRRKLGHGQADAANSKACCWRPNRRYSHPPLAPGAAAGDKHLRLAADRPDDPAQRTHHGLAQHRAEAASREGPVGLTLPTIMRLQMSPRRQPRLTRHENRALLHSQTFVELLHSTSAPPLTQGVVREHDLECQRPGEALGARVTLPGVYLQGSPLLTRVDSICTSPGTLQCKVFVDALANAAAGAKTEHLDDAGTKTGRLGHGGRRPAGFSQFLLLEWAKSVAAEQGQTMLMASLSLKRSAVRSCTSAIIQASARSA